jgi:hypothetical protein
MSPGVFLGQLRTPKDIADIASVLCRRAALQSSAVIAFLPALLAALFGVWCGTLSGGATAAGATASALALLGTVTAVGFPLPDPLRLGSAGRWLPAALWIAAAGSAFASPVPRAGRVGLLLLPAFLVLPAAVERCWAGVARGPGRPWTLRGLRAVAAVVGLVALGALAQAAASGGLATRPALPLGHHNLLAAWLVLLLPFALLPAREPGRWRWLGRGAGLGALLALLASRSLLGLLAAGIEAIVVLCLARARRGSGEDRRRSRVALGFFVLLSLLLAGGAALQVRRLGDLLAGRDPSARARAVYYAAGWKGFRARPALGWGPGATPWTIARFLVPLPGVDPPGEIVPDLHSLPLQVAYELGAPGLLLALALAGLFARRRLAELPRAADLGLAGAGLCGLAGGAVVALGSAAVTVTALPVAAALAAGAALAGARPALVPGSGERPDPADRPRRRVALVGSAIALYFLAPLLAAQLCWEHAGFAGDLRGARAVLQRAVDLDPAFPLYRARRAWLADSGALSAAVEARRAAARADRLAPLWLQAGVAGAIAGRPWAADALRRACVLDPLGPFAPFFLAVSAPDAPEAPALAARALGAEPRLAAATLWTGREDLLARAVAIAAAWPGVDPGWRGALARAVEHLPADDGTRGWLYVAVDEDPAESLSLNAFRRRPWPAPWRLVELRGAAARSLRLPSAATLPSTQPAVFAAAGCYR